MSLCPDTIREILSYGDLGVLAIGLYIDRSFNAEADALLNAYLTKTNATKDTIKILCCFDDLKPIVSFPGEPFIDTMARYIWHDNDSKVTYTMYMNEYVMLVDYSCNIFMRLPTATASCMKRTIKEIFYIDQISGKLRPYYRVTDKIAVLFTDEIMYVLHLNESSCTCRHILHHNGMSITMGWQRLSVKDIYIDPVNKKCINEENEFYDYVELDRPKKLLQQSTDVD